MMLRGMGKAIDAIDALIVKVGAIATLVGGAEAGDIIAFLKECGFVIFDLLGMSRRPLDGALAQLNVLFVKAQSPLRADRRWRGAP